jgi:hypothetical protein
LTKVDRASMMVSLESRAVFLDNDFCRFLPALAQSLEKTEWKPKMAAQESDARLTAAGNDQPQKKGFGIPLAKKGCALGRGRRTRKLRQHVQTTDYRQNVEAMPTTHFSTYCRRRTGRVFIRNLRLHGVFTAASKRCALLLRTEQCSGCHFQR